MPFEKHFVSLSLSLSFHYLGGGFEGDAAGAGEALYVIVIFFSFLFFNSGDNESGPPAEWTHFRILS